MARPRKPTAHLALVGAFEKNPQRTRDHEPVCDDPATLPPVGLSDDETEAWNFLASTAVPGVLTEMDSAYLALCAKSLAVAWSGEASITDMQRAGNMLGKLGMTPSDRSKIVVPKGPDDGPKYGKL